jgi:23S rRNA (pseudouridine1915-N3)-methyltransferase
MTIPFKILSIYFMAMEIKVLAVGKVRDRSYARKTEEYAERIRHDAKLEIVEIKDAGPELEGERILDHCRRKDADMYVLDERGKLFTSQEFARIMASASRKMMFVIGGPDGISEAVGKCARQRLSLSPMTFTHEIARLLLMEQLYRALSIIKGRKYHK